MAASDIKRCGLDPVTEQFLATLETNGAKPLCEFPIPYARNLLLQLQNAYAIQLPADIEDLTIPVGPNGKVRIRIVRPQGSIAVLPVVMYFHGGGWVLGDKETYDRFIREIANGSQVAVIFVDFERSPEAPYPLPIEEAYAATRYVAENDKILNVDASKLTVMGDSAGGNMAAVVTLLAKERGGPEIYFQVLLCPVTSADFQTQSYVEFSNAYGLTRAEMEWFWKAYLSDESVCMQHTVSPLQASIDQLKGVPPALIITSECDVVRDEGEAYARKLMEAGVCTTAVRFMGTIHDFMVLNALSGTPAARSAIELVNNMLRQVSKVVVDL